MEIPMHQFACFEFAGLTRDRSRQSGRDDRVQNAVALLSGPPWLVFLTVCYFVWRKLRPSKPLAGVAPHG